MAWHDEHDKGMFIPTGKKCVVISLIPGNRQNNIYIYLSYLCIFNFDKFVFCLFIIFLGTTESLRIRVMLTLNFIRNIQQN